MILHSEVRGCEMRCVYTLSEELRLDPQQVALTQALTLNKARPQMGLKGTYGLFGSSEWWASIQDGRMPLLFISGVVTRAYVAGQDDSGMNNTIDLLQEDGALCSVGIYVNNPQDATLFRVGHRAELVYALDELKVQPAKDGGINYSKIALEMTVSVQPAG